MTANRPLQHLVKASRREEVISFVSKRPAGSSARQIAKATGLTYCIVGALLREMRKLGDLDASGHGAGTVWATNEACKALNAEAKNSAESAEAAAARRVCLEIRRQRDAANEALAVTAFARPSRKLLVAALGARQLMTVAATSAFTYRPTSGDNQTHDYKNDPNQKIRPRSA